MNKKLLKIVVCPVCKGHLKYASKNDELICEKDKLAFPIRNKIPVLLIADARSIK